MTLSKLIDTLNRLPLDVSSNDDQYVDMVGWSNGYQVAMAYGSAATFPVSHVTVNHDQRVVWIHTATPDDPSSHPYLAP